jgi:hypothetical protein
MKANEKNERKQELKRKKSTNIAGFVSDFQSENV